MDMNLVNDDFVVCVCRKVTKKEIVDAIKKNNIKTLNELRSVMNVGNVCGGCGEDLEEIIKIVNK